MLHDFTKVLLLTDSTISNYISNREAAVWYIRNFTSNPPSNKTCPSDPSVLQDTATYNSDYSFVWNLTGCNDCTDYVSQALNHAGFPEDGIWYANAFNSAWSQPLSLKNYFENSIHKGVMLDNSYALLVGDLAFIHTNNYEDENLNWEHVVMISRINPLRYSGHTTDRLDVTVTSAFNKFMAIRYSPKPVYLALMMASDGYLDFKSGEIQYSNPYPEPEEVFIASPFDVYPPPLDLGK